MSLDVYLTLPEVANRAARDAIFIRENGATREITRAEWDERYAGREPVTFSDDGEGAEVFWKNITHNLGRMARECGLYEALWRPEEIGATHAADLIPPLQAGLARLVDDRERLEAFNPENGWGDYSGLLEFTRAYLTACERFPNAEVRVSR